MMKKTKYQLIADDLRSNILAGTFQLNQSIPSELQLQKDFDVSRHTVREAIALLVNEGYLRKEKGSGTYVSDGYLTNKNPQSQKTIGVITTYLSDYIFPSIIRGIENELSRNNYSLLLSSTNNDVQQERRSLEMMLSHQVDGLIVEPTKSNEYNPNLSYYLALKEQGIPFVMINAHYEELAAPYLALDDVRSGFLATSELLTQGHQEIGLITKIDDLQGKNRMKGFIQAFEQQRKTFNPDNVLTYTTETREDLVASLKQSLTRPEAKLTGLVCYNDEIALIVLELAKELGITVPGDLSVIGQDESFVNTVSGLKLTTITHPKEKLGQDAARLLLDTIEGKKNLPRLIEYPPQLVPGTSVKNLTTPDAL